MKYRSDHQRPPRKAWTLALAGLAAFMTALDTLVVTTALPVLRVDLHASLSELEWTVNAYNLAFACLLLTGAALGDRFGRRRMFAIGLWGGIVGLAVAAGPVVGGAVVSGIAWHWIFWLNVPVGLALIPTAQRRLTESYGPRPHLDLGGMVLAAGGALGLTWGLVRANTIGWTSGEVLTALLAGSVLVGAFIGWEGRAEHPMVPPSLFTVRGFAAANGVSFFMYAGLFGALFLMSQLLQTGLGYSPLGAGIRLLPWTLPPMIIAPIAGTLADRYGNRPFMVLGLALQAAGYAWVASVAAPGVDYVQLGAAFTISGIGTSFCFPTVANAIMSAIPMQEAGVASGINSASRELGGVLGVAVLASVFIHHGGFSNPHRFIEGFTPAVWVAVGLLGFGIVAATLTAGRAQRLQQDASIAVAVPQAQAV